MVMVLRFHVLLEESKAALSEAMNNILSFRTYCNHEGDEEMV